MKGFVLGCIDRFLHYLDIIVISCVLLAITSVLVAGTYMTACDAGIAKSFRYGETVVVTAGVLEDKKVTIIGNDPEDSGRLKVQLDSSVHFIKARYFKRVAK